MGSQPVGLPSPRDPRGVTWAFEAPSPEGEGPGKLQPSVDESDGEGREGRTSAGGNGIFLREIIHGALRPRGPRLKAREGAHPFIRCTSRAGRPRMRAPRAPSPGRALAGAPTSPGPCIGGSRPWREGAAPHPPVSSAPPGPVGGMAWPRAGGDRGRREGGAGSRARVARQGGVALQAAREQEASGPSAGGCPPHPPSWSLGEGTV